jgi:gamma-glutamyltranspeptidase/glutathione hydrolase
MGFTTRPELTGTFGMISSTHWLASAVGMAILEQGGNAFDAAVAAGFVLQVVEPHLNGLGGEVPIVLWDASRAKSEVICGQGVAAAAATIDEFVGLGLDEIPGSGLLAACVPGAFGAWMTLLRDHGTMDVDRVLHDAIGYAKDGYPLVARISSSIAAVEQVFRNEWPSSAALYLGSGVPAPGTLFRNPTLATTYRRLKDAALGGSREARIDAAVDAFYSGFVAEAIDRHCRHEFGDSTGTPHRGLLAGDDLAGWRSTIEAPVYADFGDWKVAKCGPWSQGPVFLQQLGLVAGLDLGSHDFLSDGHIHLVTEAAKLAFADREAWYGDPQFSDIPLDALLSDAYAATRRQLIGERASLELRPGAAAGAEPALPRSGAGVVASGHWTGHAGQSVAEPARDTVHVAVADRFGNFVACTPSGGWLQSSPVMEDLGFPLGTRAQMFNLDERHPNHLEPRKRPRTTLSPSLAFFKGEPCLAFGTPGGDQQDQWQFQFFLAHAVFGQDLQAAADAPSFHTSAFPSSFMPHESNLGRLHVEDRVDPSVLAALRDRGHEVVVEDGWKLGRVCAVGRKPGTRLLRAAASPRGAQAYAIGR